MSGPEAAPIGVPNAEPSLLHEPDVEPDRDAALLSGIEGQRELARAPRERLPAHEDGVEAALTVGSRGQCGSALEIGVEDRDNERQTRAGIGVVGAKDEE